MHVNLQQFVMTRADLLLQIYVEALTSSCTLKSRNFIVRSEASLADRHQTGHESFLLSGPSAEITGYISRSSMTRAAWSPVFFSFSTTSAKMLEQTLE
jgi:hypothetical protein